MPQHTKILFYFSLILILAACAVPSGTPSNEAPQQQITATRTPSERITSPTSLPATRPPTTILQEEPTPTSDNTVEQVPSVSDCQPPIPQTPSNPEGPYYKAGAPQRNDLTEPGDPGTRLILTGHVLLADCTPLPGAIVDFWQTDSQGAYDNAGFNYRGWQYTDETGAYRLETVLPGVYPGRTAHIHVKVRAPGHSELTTQIYFEGVQANQSDSFVTPELVVPLEETGDGSVQSSFDFVLGD